MIEEIKIIQIVYEHINKKLVLTDFYRDAFQSINVNIENIQKNIRLVKKDNCINVNNLYEQLIMLHIDYSDLYINLHDMYFLFKYCYKKNSKKESIFLSFNSQNTIEPLLHQTLDTMLYLKNKIPIYKTPYKSIEKAYETVGNFQKHGHYLLNFSNKKSEYTMRDLLLYIRHVNKTIATVYESGVLEIVRNFPLKD